MNRRAFLARSAALSAGGLAANLDLVCSRIREYLHFILTILTLCRCTLSP